jgi:hypothetical protein
MTDIFDVPQVKWSDSHGAVGGHQGVGALYFSLPYMLKAKRCVVVGSGAGFVPMMVLAAQRRLVREGLIEKVDVTLVDAHIGIWGLPVYEAAAEIDPELKLVRQLSSEAAAQFSGIDYLHLDADHSYAGTMADLKAYLPRMARPRWAVTVHDTYNPVAVAEGLPVGAWPAAEAFARKNRLAIVNFEIGCGTALIMPRATRLRPPRRTPVRDWMAGSSQWTTGKARGALRRARRLASRVLTPT